MNSVKDGGRLMLIMRSVLHYYKAADHLPFLRHIRRQLQEKELFLHQTLAFASHQETAAINALYALMRTTKAFFTPAEIAAMLARGGFAGCMTVLSGDVGNPLLRKGGSQTLRQTCLCLLRIARAARVVTIVVCRTRAACGIRK